MPGLTRAQAQLGLFAIALLGLGVRALGVSSVLLPGGLVALAADDASYHARLVQHAVLHFPALLDFDPLLNHPDGARVPWPPLYDALLAAIGWSFAVGPSGVDRVLAWVSPVAGALAIFPVYLGARSLTSRAMALLAAAIYALLPIAVIYARVGNPDHHAWLAAVGASYLALSLGCERASLRTPWRWTAGLVAVRVCIALGWSGSLLILAIGEGALVLAAIVAGNRVALRLQVLGCLAAAALVLPVVMTQREPLGGWFSASALSALQVLFLLGVSTICAAWLVLEKWRPAIGPRAGLLRGAGLAFAVLLLGLSIPPLREGVAPAFSYLSASRGFLGNPEQFALYSWMRSGVGRSLPGSFYYYAAFAYVLPLPLLAALHCMRDRRRRSAAVVLSLWTALLGTLAVSQLRWGNDFAPAAAIGFALAIGLAQDALAPRRAAGRRLLAALCLTLLASPLVVHLPKLQREIETFRDPSMLDRRSPAVPLVRFAQQVNEAVWRADAIDSTVPAARGAILANPRYGHVLHRMARLATPGDNFGPQFDAERYDRVLAFFGAHSQEKGMRLFREFEVRWLMTDRAGRRKPGLVAVRLHDHDGSAHAGKPALDAFRLVAEATAGGVGLGGWLGPDPPYKLFEWVEGARIVVETRPGAVATARLEIVTPWGREFEWHTSARADETGRIVLRIPYPTESSAGVAGRGPAVLVVDGREQRVAISEAQVRNGSVVHLAPRFGSETGGIP